MHIIEHVIDLVRVHRALRTIVFSPVGVPDDPPPVDVKHIEVLRTIKPVFAGTQWAEMSVLDDACTRHTPGVGHTVKR